MVLRENNQGHSIIAPLHLLTLFVIPTRNLEIGERDMPLSTDFSKVQASQSEEEDDEGSYGAVHFSTISMGDKSISCQVRDFSPWKYMRLECGMEFL